MEGHFVCTQKRLYIGLAVFLSAILLLVLIHPWNPVVREAVREESLTGQYVICEPAATTGFECVRFLTQAAERPVDFLTSLAQTLYPVKRDPLYGGLFRDPNSIRKWI